MYSSHQSALYQEGRYQIHTQWQQVLQSRPDTQRWWQRGRDSSRIQGNQHKLAANDTELGHELANQKCSGWSRHLVPCDNQWWQDCHLHKCCSTALELWSNLWRGSVPVSQKKPCPLRLFHCGFNHCSMTIHESNSPLLLTSAIFGKLQQ